MRKNLKASFTIEAGMIVPLIMFITVTVFLVCFFIHDRAVMKSAALYYAIESAEAEEQSLESLRQVLDVRLTRAKDISVSQDGTKDKITINADAQLPPPFLFESMLTGSEFSSLSTRADISNLNGRKALLKYKVAADAAKALSKDKGAGQ